jgi:phage N-6-adenine-methyltransferase
LGKFAGGRFGSAKQCWTTPDDLFARLDSLYHFDFDLAADKDNTKLPRFFSETEDALQQTWVGSCWLNPPYGGTSSNKLENWVKKAYLETRKLGTKVVMLIPARTNTNWWHQYCMEGAKEILFICGRPKFGDARHGLPQPLAIICFQLTDEPCKYKTFRLVEKEEKCLE